MKVCTAKSLRMLMAVFVPLFALAPATNAQLHDVNADYDTGFASGSNPNGVWTYGWASTPTSTLNLYTRNHIAGFGNGQMQAWDDPNNLNQSTPLVYKNAGAAFNDGNIVIPTGALILHGGGTSQTDLSVVRFTAPTTATYELTTDFIGRQFNINATVEILHNGVSLFDDTITAHLDSANFVTHLQLNAGDTLDFAAGLTVFGPGSVELQSRIGVVPAPGALAVVLMGSVPGALALARRRR